MPPWKTLKRRKAKDAKEVALDTLLAVVPSDPRGDQLKRDRAMAESLSKRLSDPNTSTGRVMGAVRNR